MLILQRVFADYIDFVGPYLLSRNLKTTKLVVYVLVKLMSVNYSLIVNLNIPLHNKCDLKSICLNMCKWQFGTLQNEGKNRLRNKT